MLFVVRHPDGHEINIQAEGMCVDAAGRYRFHDTEGSFMELPASNVEHVRLVETKPERDR